jgi:hypothetical protein
LPYLQPATNTYFGFQPAQAGDGSQSLNPYIVSSSEANDINIGDVVVISTKGTVRVITGTWSTGILGVAASFVKAGDGSTSANVLNGPSSQIVLVYDGPTQVFVTHDSTSGVIADGSMGKTVSIISTGVAGSTGASGSLHRSTMVISGASTSALLPFKYLGMHPAELGVVSSGTTTVTSSGTRLHLVQMNAAVRDPSLVVVTT